MCVHMAASKCWKHAFERERERDKKTTMTMTTTTVRSAIRQIKPSSGTSFSIEWPNQYRHFFSLYVRISILFTSTKLHTHIRLIVVVVIIVIYIYISRWMRLLLLPFMHIRHINKLEFLDDSGCETLRALFRPNSISFLETLFHVVVVVVIIIFCCTHIAIRSVCAKEHMIFSLSHSNTKINSFRSLFFVVVVIVPQRTMHEGSVEHKFPSPKSQYLHGRKSNGNGNGIC